MTTLIENLSYIYDIKQDIKEVIGTNSDLFSEYPQLIQEAIDEVPAGYTYVSGTYNITENGTFDVKNYENAYVTVSGEIPPGYIIPAGDYMSNISEWETVIDGENPSEMTVNLTSPDISEYETVTIGLQGHLPENASYIYENGLVEVNPLEAGLYNTYIYVDVPIPAGYTYVSGSYSISYSGDYDVSSYKYAYVSVSPSVSGTYYVTDNGTYDISEYEYVDVDVSGSSVTTYTWTGLSRGGNPDVNQSGESSDNNNNALMLYVKTGSSWYNQQYYQIVPSRQFAYQLPTSITARNWDDYNHSTYIMTDYSGCTYSCDPSNYDNLTNVMNTNGGSNGQDCSYEVSGLDVYGSSSTTTTAVDFFGSTVHTLRKLVDLRCIQWNTDDPSNPYEENVKSTMLCAALTDANHTAYIPETSYFGEMTDIRNLAGRTWKMIFNQYQGRLTLKDIVGPVSGSEIYMNEIDDVWANWMGGWNSSTSSSYNTATGNIELQYTANYVLSNAPSIAELHQLEYRLISGGTARRIDTEVVGSLGTADHTNLSGTVTLNAIPRTNENYHYVDLFYIDNSDLQNEGYTQYDLTLTLKIPHDMWLYGSANHNQMTLDWTLTPSSTAITDDVTALQTSVGTSWYTGNRVSGTGSGGQWTTTVTKSNKSTSNLENYKIYEINVTGTTSGQHNFVPDLNSPDSLDINNLSGSIDVALVDREDQNGKQMFTLDTTDLPATANLEVQISVPEKVLDPDDSYYMQCHIDYQITY